LFRSSGVVFSENEIERGGQAVVGSLQKRVLNCFTVAWVVIMVSVLLGKVFIMEGISTQSLLLKEKGHGQH
jgi:hypothetical protein